MRISSGVPCAGPGRFSSGSRTVSLRVLALAAGLTIFGPLPAVRAEEPRIVKPAPKSGENSRSDKGTSSPTPAEKKETTKEPAPVPRMTGSGYAKALEDMDPQEVTRKGVKLKVRIIADGYAYLLARKLEDLEETGYEDEEIRKLIRSYHADIKDRKGKVLFLASVTAGAETSFFVTQEVRKHVAVAQKTSKTCSVFDVSPRPEFAKWKLFEYPPYGGVKRTTPSLARLQNLSFKAASSSIKISDKEPITLEVTKLLARTKSDDVQSSINVDERQIAARGMADLTASDLVVTFKPGKWKIPRPPAGFAEFTAWLEGK